MSFLTETDFLPRESLVTEMDLTDFFDGKSMERLSRETLFLETVDGEMDLPRTKLRRSLFLKTCGETDFLDGLDLVERRFFGETELTDGLEGVDGEAASLMSIFFLE